MNNTIPHIGRLPVSYAKITQNQKDALVKNINDTLERIGSQERIGDNLKIVQLGAIALSIRQENDNVTIFFQNRNMEHNGRLFLSMSNSSDYYDVDIEDDMLELLVDIVENNDAYNVDPYEIDNSDIHYECVQDGSEYVYVIYGRHEYLNSREYVFVQECINAGKVLSENFYNHVIQMDCECEECGSESGYVNTGKVNSEGFPIYVYAEKFSYWD